MENNGWQEWRPSAIIVYRRGTNGSSLLPTQNVPEAADGFRAAAGHAAPHRAGDRQRGALGYGGEDVLGQLPGREAILPAELL